ncbi:MAG: HlyD family type I secretion periplasmic adaptor subunit, partial [Chitinophagaceae bacterium]|nr:HlyD family type I secretion periplasmic adaptor subunit [Rubrivivax sp.]
RVTDAGSGRAWFEVTLEVDSTAAAASSATAALRPGMPAEAFITTGKRTLIEYLLKPLTLFSQRALREA